MQRTRSFPLARRAQPLAPYRPVTLRIPPRPWNDWERAGVGLLAGSALCLLIGGLVRALDA